MEKSKVLLSQAEIDTLLEFLNEKKVSSAIMDQESIDKLITFLKSDDGADFHMEDVDFSDESAFDSTVFALPGNENLDHPDDLRLETVQQANGIIDVVCVNITNGNKYVISPACLEKLRFTEDSSSVWGLCIPPAVFDTVARVIGIKYTKKTYVDVCSRFAEIVFGIKGFAIANLYLPSESALLERMINE